MKPRKRERERQKGDRWCCDGEKTWDFRNGANGFLEKGREGKSCPTRRDTVDVRHLFCVVFVERFTRP